MTEAIMDTAPRTNGYKMALLAFSVPEKIKLPNSMVAMMVTA